MSRYLKVIVFFSMYILSALTSAAPWFTGPILAPSGHTMPKGHTNFEFYTLDALTNGQYDANGNTQSIPLFRSLVFNPIITHGFTDWFDVQLLTPYTFNSTQGVHYNRITDTSVGLGFQLTEQRKSKWLPDIRVVIQETFPTGNFDELNPAFLGADATGLGSYRTLFSVNFQYLQNIYDEHYLRTRLIFSRLVSAPVDVIGLNSFGGTQTTRGRINPGAEDNIDLAFEYTLTQNWVAVMEGYYSEGKATRFNGILDFIADDDINNTSLADNDFEYGLAPAIEYNFTGNIGIIGGVWFPIKGKNTSRFTTYVLAINAFF